MCKQPWYFQPMYVSIFSSRFSLFSSTDAIHHTGTICDETIHPHIYPSPTQTNVIAPAMFRKIIEEDGMILEEFILTNGCHYGNVHMVNNPEHYKGSVGAICELIKVRKVKTTRSKRRRSGS